MAELATAAGATGMIAGQAMDIGLDGPVDSAEALERLHAAKTGALITAACRMGAVSAGATPEQLARLTRYGRALGLSFQLADDLLDAEQDAGDGGPPSFVRLAGIEATRHRAHQAAREALDAAGDAPILADLARFAVDRTH